MCVRVWQTISHGRGCAEWCSAHRGNADSTRPTGARDPTTDVPRTSKDHPETDQERTQGLLLSLSLAVCNFGHVSTSLIAFKRRLKTLLFSHSFDLWQSWLLFLTCMTCRWFYFFCCWVLLKFFWLHGTIIFVHNNNNNNVEEDVIRWVIFWYWFIIN